MRGYRIWYIDLKGKEKYMYMSAESKEDIRKWVPDKLTIKDITELTDEEWEMINE